MKCYALNAVEEYNCRLHNFQFLSVNLLQEFSNFYFAVHVVVNGVLQGAQ
jgi:hypothetical protein